MMIRSRLVFLVVLAVTLPGPARSQGADSPTATDVMTHVRADRWAEAEAAAARYPDPVVAKLALYFRLLAPASAGVREIAAFMTASPDWPQQAALARRRDEALAGETDDATLRAECIRIAPQATAALLRCGQTLGAEGSALLRRAWISGITEAAFEQRFLHEHGALLTRADHVQRFEQLIWSAAAAASRQVAHLPAAARPAAEARLALRRDDPGAMRLLAVLPEAARTDPGLFYDQVTWLRRSGQDEAARDLWLASGAAADRTVAEERRGAFWNERNLMARRRLRQGDASGAYAIAAGFAGGGVEQAVEATFLAGFIALRKLNDAARAEGHFRALEKMSRAAITQGRAHYWLGRTADLRGDTEQAQAAYAAAGKWPNTFYGQLGALRTGETAATLAARITATGDPQGDAARASDLAGRELTRAAAYLVGWGEARRAQQFLLRLDEVAPDPADRGLTARLATGLGMPETAVAIARRAGRDGVILLGSGWPMPVTPPAMPVPEAAMPVPEAAIPVPEAALSLGIIRQESSFDTAVISPVGARGLMQLMPATAASMARKLGVTASVPALVLDPSYNMRLGTGYLRDLLEQFSGATPLAIAAYNAGPSRVTEWVATNGDPRTATVDVLDWIELIPFSETRNYVQRVIENQVVYRAKRGEIRAHPLLAAPR